MGSTGYWEIRTYECGALGEKTKYWVPGEPPARGRKLGRSSERKQRQNENDAVRRLNREIHANFSAGDLFLGLDYGPKKYSELLRRAEARQEADRAAGQEPGILEDYLRKEANRELDNFIRRVKRRLPPGAELKYIAVTSDMDGETGRAKGLHAAGGVSAEPGSPPARREEVQALPQPCEASAEVPRRMERGGAARAEGLRAAVPHGLLRQTSGAVYPLCAALCTDAQLGGRDGEEIQVSPLST